MPTYDYVCDACEHQFEHFQSIKDESLRKCPKCGKLKLRRLIGPGAAVIFKGTGFYETDYRKKSGVKPTSEKSSSASSASKEKK